MEKEMITFKINDYKEVPPTIKNVRSGAAVMINNEEFIVDYMNMGGEVHVHGTTMTYDISKIQSVREKTHKFFGSISVEFLKFLRTELLSDGYDIVEHTHISRINVNGVDIDVDYDASEYMAKNIYTREHKPRKNRFVELYFGGSIPSIKIKINEPFDKNDVLRRINKAIKFRQELKAERQKSEEDKKYFVIELEKVLSDAAISLVFGSFSIRNKEMGFNLPNIGYLRLDSNLTFVSFAPISITIEKESDIKKFVELGKKVDNLFYYVGLIRKRLNGVSGLKEMIDSGNDITGTITGTMMLEFLRDHSIGKNKWKIGEKEYDNEYDVRQLFYSQF